MKFKRIITLSFLSVFLCGLLIGLAANNSNLKPISVSAWSLDVKPSVESTFYSSCDGKTGTSLKSALASFNKPTNTSYDWSRYEAADEAQDDSTSILSLYTRHNIKKNSHCGNYSWDKWNREHVYTQTKFPNSKTDNHNIFACEGQINGYRGDKEFANLKGKGGTQVTVFGHLTNCYQTGDYFEPCDEAKGEVARACLYCSVYYGYDLNDIFDSIDTCLEWNSKFPVTPREIYRNNVVQGLQGNRNPFSDHPSYAQAIYGGPTYSWADPVDGGGFTPVSVDGISLDNTSVSVAIGSTTVVSATISPSNATNKNITWSSENTSIATVKSGTITGVSAGITTIKAVTEDGGFEASCSVSVYSVPVTGVSINHASISIQKGQSSSLIASVLPANASNKSVTWSSENTSLVTVTSSGTVNAIDIGKTNVKVTTADGGFTASCEVTVTEAVPYVAVESVSLNETRVELKVGETFQLKATINPSNATNKDVVWSVESLDPEAEYSSVLVTSAGFVTADSEGYSLVTVTTVDGLKTAECKFVVKNKTTPKGNSGCGGNVITSSVVLSTLSIIGVSALIIRKIRVKKEDWYEI